VNFRYVINQLSLLFAGLSAIMLSIAVWAHFEPAGAAVAERDAVWALAISALFGLTIAAVAYALTRNPQGSLARREALLLVGCSWLIGAALAGLPYYLWANWATDVPAARDISSWQSCYFEAMSGLTTTGATTLTKVATLPRGLLLWRAMTHWLGGLGIVVLFVAVLPSIGAGSKRLYRVEAPGPDPEGVHPHIRETARILWLIYVGLTVLEMVALRICGMSWFDATCHTFATLATGGFSTQDSSITAFNSNAIQWVIILFMVLAGVNFGLYFQLIRGRFAAVWRDRELRLYLSIMLVAATIVTITLSNRSIQLTDGRQLPPSIATAANESVFTVVSLQTTTGFCTADFHHWPFVAKAILLGLMLVGGSAGSTGGGIKVIRVLITAKVMWAEIERAFRPQVVRPLQVGKTTISPELRMATLSYVFGIILIAAVGACAVKAIEGPKVDIVTAGSASIATLCNIGPGLGEVRSSRTYANFAPLSKAVMSLLMALGRLEVFAILVLITPRFWRST